MLTGLGVIGEGPQAVLVGTELEEPGATCRPAYHGEGQRQTGWALVQVVRSRLGLSQLAGTRVAGS